jgi:O-methyltransferase involved in polyketide biosynthesis
VATLTLQFADPVSQTLLIPLWARALEQGEPDPLVRDPLAAEIVAQIDYDWRRIRLSRGDLVQCVVRLREFDRFVPGSALEPDWIEQLGLSGAGPVLIVAEAVLVYLEEVGGRDLLVALRGRCPGAELITDMCTPLAMRLDNLHLLVTRSSARIQRYRLGG